MEMRAAQDQARYESMSEKDVAREIRQLEKQMQEHARNLEFEKAAQARDRLAALRRNLFGASPEAALLAESELQSPLVGGPDQIEAVTAHLQKRAPVFTDPE